MAQRNNLPHALAKQASLFEGLVYCWHVLFFWFWGLLLTKAKTAAIIPSL